MFRNVVHGARDMYITDWNLEGEISRPRKLGMGSWKIDACPMDGGGISHRGGATVTAWRRDETVYVDQVGQPEIAIGEGKDVALALSANGAYVAWTSPSGIQIHRPEQKEPLCLSQSGSFAALTSLADGKVLAAWEQDGAIQMKLIE